MPFGGALAMDGVGCCGGTGTCCTATEIGQNTLSLTFSYFSNGSTTPQAAPPTLDTPITKTVTLTWDNVTQRFVSGNFFVSDAAYVYWDPVTHLYSTRFGLYYSFALICPNSQLQGLKGVTVASMNYIYAGTPYIACGSASYYCVTLWTTMTCSPFYLTKTWTDGLVYTLTT